MASQSLYRKWRSQTFDEMVGQEEIIRTLKNAYTTNALSHAYLFTGPRGTGKTTSARLLAKIVNCADPQNGEPCNECAQCREITLGNSFNVIEIDAASNRGIDSIRELREKVMVPPSTGKYKIYILDEAHMLTTEAFNALLKTLEEPPEYAIFVMATTDVHKMLPTVISRCQRLDFKRIATRQIVEHLLHVAHSEQIEIEQSAAELLARTAAGGMRDALSLLDQAIAYAGERISLAQVQTMLGVADPRAISKLITYIAALESPALLYMIHELSEAGADLRQINNQMVEYWRALMLAKAGADVASILDLTEDEFKDLQHLIPAFTLDELTEYARIFAQNELMYKNQGTPQLGLELASLECLELHRKAREGNSGTRQPGAAVRPPAHVELTATSVSSASTTLSAAPALRAEIIAPVQKPVEHQREQSYGSNNPSFVESQPVVEAPPQISSTPSVASRITLQEVMTAWPSVIKRTKQKSGALGTYIGFCEVIGLEEENEHTVVILRASQQRHVKFIREEDRPKEVEWALTTEFNLPCKMRVLAPDQAYTASQVQNSLAVLSPQPSAHREPLRVSFEPSATQPVNPAPPSQRHIEVAPTPAPATKSRPGENVPVPPLARSSSVSENKKVTLSKAELQKKAQQDPVVQEVQKMFRATIKDIQPK